MAMHDGVVPGDGGRRGCGWLLDVGWCGSDGRYVARRWLPTFSGFNNHGYEVPIELGRLDAPAACCVAWRLNGCSAMTSAVTAAVTTMVIVTTTVFVAVSAAVIAVMAFVVGAGAGIVAWIAAAVAVVAGATWACLGRIVVARIGPSDRWWGGQRRTHTQGNGKHADTTDVYGALPFGRRTEAVKTGCLLAVSRTGCCWSHFFLQVWLGVAVTLEEGSRSFLKACVVDCEGRRGLGPLGN
jgi:hypothetical protein